MKEIQYAGNGTAGIQNETKPTGFFFQMPPQRTWVGLTDEQISDLWCKVSNTDFVTADTHVFAKAIEAKLKEKNT
jgi:hypothetical protein